MRGIAATLQAAFLLSALVMDGPTGGAAHQYPSVVSVFSVGTDRVVGVGADHATNRVFIGRQPISSGFLSLGVVDGSTGTPLSQIPLGSGAFLYSIEPNSASGKVYAVDSFTNTIFVIDEAASVLLTSIDSELSVGPACVAVNPGTNRTYWLESGQVSVMDGATDEIIAAISVPSPDIRDCAINVIRNRLYVTNLNSYELFVIDLASGTIVETVNLDSPGAVAVNPVTGRIYVVNNLPGTLTVLNGDTNAIEAVVPVSQGGFEADVQVNPATNRIYFSDSGSHSVSVIDAASNTVVASLQMGGGSLRLAVDSVTDRVYVAQDSIVSVIGNGPAFPDTGGRPAVDTATRTGFAVMALALLIAGAALGYLANRHSGYIRRDM